MTTVFFDKDQGAEIAIRALGGKYQNLRRGLPTGYNPFLRPDTERNNDFLFRLMRQLVGRELSPREEQELNSAIREIMRSSDHVRSISGLCQLLPPTDERSLHAHLQPWCRGGRLGWVFDNPEDCLDLESGDLFGFDDTELLDDPEVSVPLTMYLLHCTETLIDGRRFCYVMAEFWKRLDSPAFTDFARNKQYTIRKQNGFGVFDTQSPDQILQSKHGKALVGQSPTQIYLPNPKADYEDYVNGFKVSEQEFEIIRSLNPNSRQFLIKQSTDPTDGQPTQDSQSVVATLDMKGMDDVLDILSGTLDNVELLDGIRAEVGDDPDIWMPIYRERLRARRGG
jgi:type IV secretion system protein VirB4